MHCVSNGIDNDSSILWILPNGHAIYSTSATAAKVVNNSQQSLILPLQAITHTGVYSCIVKDRIIDGTIAKQHVWVATKLGKLILFALSINICVPFQMHLLLLLRNFLAS